VQKLKKNNSGAKRLMNSHLPSSFSFQKTKQYRTNDSLLFKTRCGLYMIFTKDQHLLAIFFFPHSGAYSIEIFAIIEPPRPAFLGAWKTRPWTLSLSGKTVG